MTPAAARPRPPRSRQALAGAEPSTTPPRRGRRIGRRPEPAPPDVAGPFAEGGPALPAILASLPAYPAETGEILRRCLGLGCEPEAAEAVADALGMSRSMVTYRIGQAMRVARRSFAWARQVETMALERVGTGRVPVAVLAREPWAAGLGPQALQLMLPRLTDEALRLRGRGANARLCRRGVFLREG